MRGFLFGRFCALRKLLPNFWLGVPESSVVARRNGPFLLEPSSVNAAGRHDGEGLQSTDARRKSISGDPETAP
jgi:hypothetical protein